MLAYDLFIVTLGSLFALTTLLLAAFKVSQWNLYYSLYLIEYLALSSLLVLLNPRARRVLDSLGYILLPGFGAILVLKIAEVLWGFSL